MTETIKESWNKHDTKGQGIRPTTGRSSVMFKTDDGTVSVDPSAVVDKIERAEGTAERFDNELPSLPLPGTGRLGDDCGDEIPRFCSDCGATSYVGRTCYRQSCPRCWKGWDRRRATTVTSKLEALRRYREAAGGDGWNGWKFHHLVLSPPDGFAVDSEEPLQRTFDLLKEVSAEIGAETGYLFYHPFRGPDGDDRGFWKEVLPEGEEVVPSDTLGSETTPPKAGTAKLVEEHGLQHSPHFHAVVLSKYVGTENVVGHIEEKTGWTIHRITKSEDSDVSLYNEYDLARSVSYCLSHTGMGENRVAYRAFGEVANFSADEQIEAQMDAAVRSVATNTLGLEYSSVACTVERDITEIREIEVERYAEKVNLGAANGGGGGGPDVETMEIEETERDNCDGRLLDIKKAPRFVNDDEWVEAAVNSSELIEEWEEWRERIDDSPNG